MQDKGLVLTTVKALVVLLAIACVVSVYVLLNKVFYEFHILPLELQYKKNTLILARVLMSNENLTYVSKTPFRTTLDAEKLSLMNGKSIEEIGYSGSISLITVIDVENGKVWNFYVEGKVKMGNLDKFLSCMKEYVKLTVPVLTLLRGNVHKFIECIHEQITTKGTFYDEFAISIRYGNETHVGKLILTYFQG